MSNPNPETLSLTLALILTLSRRRRHSARPRPPDHGLDDLDDRLDVELLLHVAQDLDALDRAFAGPCLPRTMTVHTVPVRLGGRVYCLHVLHLLLTHFCAALSAGFPLKQCMVWRRGMRRR